MTYLNNPLYKKIINEKNIVIQLKQEHFDIGTLEIDESGIKKINGDYVAQTDSKYLYIKLSGNIEFDPIKYDKNKLFEASHISSKNSDKPYNLGLFAAIAIKNYSDSDSISSTDDMDRGIIFDFNGYSIKQSIRHCLLQRFFSIIELAESPFILNQGPVSTSGKNLSDFKYAKNVFIIDSQRNNNDIDHLNFDKSTHYGIHGNKCQNIYLHDLHFKNYQVAGISINQPQIIHIENCRLLGHDQDKALRGTFSAINFLKPYLNKLNEKSITTLKISGNELNIYNNVKNAVNKIGELLLNKQESVSCVKELYNKLWLSNNLDKHYYKLFANEIVGDFKAVQDCGAYYGILFGGKGVQINGFKAEFEEKNAGSQIMIKNVYIENVLGNPTETIALADADLESGTIVKLVDPVGSALNIFLTFKNPDTNTYNYLSFNNLPEARSITNRAKITNYVINNKTNYYNYILMAQTFVIHNNSHLSDSDLPGIQKIASLSNFSLWTKYTNWIGLDKIVSNSLYHVMGGGENIDDKYRYSNLMLNFDQMFHVIKGCVCLKIDNCKDIEIEGLHINNVKNYGYLGSNLNGRTYYNGDSLGSSVIIKSDTNNDDNGYNGLQNIPGYQGCLIRGISLASCRNIKINNYNLSKVNTRFSAIYGIDIMYQTNNINYITNYYLDNIYVGQNENKEIGNHDYINIDNPTIIPYIKCINTSNPRTIISAEDIYLDFNKSEKCQIYNDNYASSSYITDCSNNCFLKGSIVNTDSGRKMIQNITTNDSINGLRVIHLHEKISLIDDLLVIKKHTFAHNMPNKDTYITQNHGIKYRNKIIPAYILLKSFDNIKRARLSQLPIYNIELEKYSHMIVNNIQVETYREI